MKRLPQALSSHLGRRLALFSVIVGLILTPLLSGLVLLFEYQDRTAQLEGQVDEIVRTSQPALEEALWLGDLALVTAQLDGLRNFRDMVYVQIDLPDKAPIVQGRQKAAGEQLIERSLPILRRFRDKEMLLGTLSLAVSLDRLRQDIRQQIGLIVLMQSLLIFAVSGLMLFGYHHLAGKRLRRMAEFIGDYRAGEGADQGKGKRILGSEVLNAKTVDELDQVAIEFNQLLIEQESSILALERANARLTEEVAARTLAEQALVQARDAAELANRAKSSFLANMSHELRTPMNAIMGMTELVFRHMTDPKQKEQLNKVKHASQHLLAIINDILDVSKIEAGRINLEHIPFKLGRVLDHMHSLIGQKAQEKGLRLSVEVFPGLAERPLQGDPVRLGQILLNLVGNAIKFTAVGAIRVRVLLVQEVLNEVELRFEVQDSGIGIAAQDQKRLFTAFEQADSSMSRKYGGTGLGLAISKRLVQMMGGQIGIESQEGTGSTFWFTVRLTQAAVNFDAPPSQSVSAAEKQFSATGTPETPAQETTSEALLARLATIPHINMARGLSVLHGNTDKYLALLLLFVESHREDMTRLVTTLGENDLATALRLVLTLKGSGATLGLEHIAALAENLENVLRASQGDSFQIDQVRSAMDAIALELATLAAALSVPQVFSSPIDVTPVDANTQKAVLDDLSVLLEQSDTAALSFLTEHALILRSVLGQPYAELMRQIGIFNFERASEILKGGR
jgi:signal transduction histidine kinase/HPt (histidine-containing phosphotransfer) domain-containing protein